MRSSRLHLEFGRRKPVGRAVLLLRRTPTACFDPALRLDQRVGAEPFDRRRGRQDGSRASAGVDEPADQVLVRPRLLRFFAEPVSELTRRAAREGPEAVQAAQLGKMLVPGLGPDRVVSGPRRDVPNGRLRHMLIGYARVSKTDGSQSLDPQRDALRAAGVDDAVNLYHDLASGVRDDRPGLDNCLRALRKGDVLVVWKLDRLGRNLAHLVNTVQDLSTRGVGLRVLAGQGAQIDTTTAGGRLVFGIFAALAEFERS